MFIRGKILDTISTLRDGPIEWVFAFGTEFKKEIITYGSHPAAIVENTSRENHQKGINS